MELEEFLNSGLRNAHIYEDGIEIYVRRPTGASHDADVELATLSADVPGNKALTRFLDRHEGRYTFYVENILEPRLAEYFLRRGYRMIGQTQEFPDTCMLSAGCKHRTDPDFVAQHKMFLNFKM